MRRKIWSSDEFQANAVDDGEDAATASRPAGGEGGVLGIRQGGEGSPRFGGEGSGGGEQESDLRLKEDVVAIGRTVHDLPLYSFRYKGAPEQYSGVMAQDVLAVMPEAVSVGSDGYYRVNYGMLGIAMARLN